MRWAGRPNMGIAAALSAGLALHAQPSLAKDYRRTASSIGSRLEGLEPEPELDGPESSDAADLEAAAKEELLKARLQLLRAARSVGRNDLARSVADLEEDRVEEARGIGALTSRDYLENDLRKGWRLSALPGYLTQAKETWPKIELLITCESTALPRRAYADARICWRFQTDLADTPIRKAANVQDALRIAAHAARADQSEIAAGMVEEALRASVRVPWEAKELDIGFDVSGLDLLAAVKADLRAKGQLPPKPAVDPRPGNGASA